MDGFEGMGNGLYGDCVIFYCLFLLKFLMENQQAHVEDIKPTHLRNLMNDTERCKSMMV